MKRSLCVVLCWALLAGAVGADHLTRPVGAGSGKLTSGHAATKPDTAALLLARGDRSAAAGHYAQALDDWRRAFQECFPSFRGLAFRSPVRAEFLSRAGLRSKLIKELAKEMPDREVRAQQKALVCLGFVAPGFDLKGTLFRMLTDEIAGFYDPKAKRLFLISEEPVAGPGSKTAEPDHADFDPDGQKMGLLHEMSHALMDQHHDLLALDHSAAGDDDRDLALKGLVEGEATLDMLVGANGESHKSMLRLHPGLISFLFDLVKPLLAFASSPSFQKAPPILKETLIFPYLKGMSFCLALTSKQGSWKPVDAAFSHPPLSTEQVLHPAKYPGHVPVALSFPDLASALGSGWSSVTSNVLGELQTRILLEGTLPLPDAMTAAEGWGGDFYRIYEHAAPQEAEAGAPPDLLLAWATTWDTPADADEFQSAFTRVLSARMSNQPEQDSGLKLPAGVKAAFWRSKERAAAVLTRGKDVWVFTGIPERAWSQVGARGLHLTRKPKTMAGEVHQGHHQRRGGS